jgi:hypothetical protein
MKMKNLARCDIADTFRSRMLNAEDGLGMMWECGERGMLILLMLLRCQKINNEERDHAMICTNLATISIFVIIVCMDNNFFPPTVRICSKNEHDRSWVEFSFVYQQDSDTYEQ